MQPADVFAGLGQERFEREDRWTRKSDGEEVEVALLPKVERHSQTSSVFDARGLLFYGWNSTTEEFLKLRGFERLGASQNR